MTAALLAVLEEAGLVALGEDGAIAVRDPAESVEEQVAQPGRAVRDPAHAGRPPPRFDHGVRLPDECRAVLLRRYFGEDDGTPCGLCDICRGRPERPSSFWEPIAQPERKKKKRRRGNRRRRNRRREIRPEVLTAPLTQVEGGAEPAPADRRGSVFPSTTDPAAT